MKAPDKRNLKDLKKSTLQLPTVIFGTSGLGNLFVALEEEEKLNIISECVRLSKGKVVFDSAGKYGAGLALETLGKCLKLLNVHPDNVIISNKLAWVRSELKTDEPTFEPGVWKNLKHDAVQRISYDGILECFKQGNELLGGYTPQMVSVHDPDEYIATAHDDQQSQKLFEDILDAYEALYDLKRQGKVQAIGVGAKDWKIIKRIAEDVKLDKLEPADITTATIQQYLCTAAFPDPELMIRTSGEYRISNFLLYQLAYAELYFTNTLWPDFRKENLYEAILDYQSRERRFGKTSEQLKDEEITKN